jgi:hypothetical protein
MGSFESWTRTIGGVLNHAGIIDQRTRRPAFLANTGESWNHADDTDIQWEEFLRVIRESYGSKAFTVKEISERTKVKEAMKEALPLEFATDLEEHPARFPIRLGRAFSSRENTRFGDSGIHVERDGTKHRAVRWKVVLG